MDYIKRYLTKKWKEKAKNKITSSGTDLQGAEHPNQIYK